jgi:hypothetical protein
VGALLQSVADKEALLGKMSSLLEISTEAKRQVTLNLPRPRPRPRPLP